MLKKDKTDAFSPIRVFLLFSIHHSEFSISLPHSVANSTQITGLTQNTLLFAKMKDASGREFVYLNIPVERPDPARIEWSAARFDGGIIV
jgi:hypothetical protein